MPDWLENLFKILFVILFFGLSVFFHELGHLLIAMWRGMHIEKFSIGFGKKIWGFKYKGIDFIIGLLPFGGYVALPQMEPVDEIQTSAGEPLEPAKPFDRILVALAGPAFNIIFAFALGFIVWKAGVLGPAPTNQVVINSVIKDSPEDKAGLKPGDKLIAVNGQSFDDTLVLRELLVLDSEVTLTVKRQDKEFKIGPYKTTKSLDPRREGLPEQQFTWNSSKAVVAGLSPDFPAAKAGIKVGDEIKSINGIETKYIHEVSDQILSQNSKELNIKIVREDKEQVITLTPKWENELGIIFGDFPKIHKTRLQAKRSGLIEGDEFLSLNNKTFKSVEELRQFIKNKNGEKLKITYKREGESLESEIIIGRPMIGVAWKQDFAITHPTPLEQVTKVFKSTFRTLKALISPDSNVGLKHMSSVVGISQNIYQAVSAQGIIFGLSFILMINVSLAIFNLLPIPVLDGGHIVFASLELIAQRKISAKVLQPLYFVFVILLITLMLFATTNDIRRARQKDVKYEYVQNDPKQTLENYA